MWLLYGYYSQIKNINIKYLQFVRPGIENEFSFFSLTPFNLPVEYETHINNSQEYYQLRNSCLAVLSYDTLCYSMA